MLETRKRLSFKKIKDRIVFKKCFLEPRFCKVFMKIYELNKLKILKVLLKGHEKEVVGGNIVKCFVKKNIEDLMAELKLNEIQKLSCKEFFYA